MPQYYTLEEAASKLNMPADELRELAKQKKVRAFQDRGSWRFRTQEIDEMARERGLGSDPELQPADAAKSPPRPRPSKLGPKSPPPDEERVAIDFDLDTSQPASGKNKPPSSKSGPRSPAPKAAKGDSDVRLVMDSNLDFQIEMDSDVRLEESGSRPRPPRKSKLQPGDSSVRLVSDKPSDSDVKVVPPAGQKPDSDVRRRPSKLKRPSDSDLHLLDLPGGGPTEELIDLDAEEAARAEKKPTTPARKPRLTQAGSSPVLPTTSPFELSENDLTLDAPPPSRSGPRPASRAKADTDSSSDFELVAFDASKSPDQLGSGEVPLLSGDEDVELGDLAGPGAGTSGINLQDPADSGISLEQGGSDEIEFELSLDSGNTPKPARAEEPATEDSSSEFELSLDDAPSDPSSSEFELSLDDSSSDTSSSEFELSLDDAPSDPSSSEFELSLDSGDDAGLATEESSDSEFELTLDDEGGLAVEDEPGKDIFEPTNFDVPALDDESGSEAVAIDEATDLDDSEFEISLDDEDSGSDSQVVALEDEEEADAAAATVARPRRTASKSKLARSAAVEEEDEAGLELDLDLERSGARRRRDADEETGEASDEELVAAAPAPPAEWGPLPAVLLLPTMVVLFLVGLMGYELVQGMYGYNRPTRVSKMIIHPIARAIDDSLPPE